MIIASIISQKPCFCCELTVKGAIETEGMDGNSISRRSSFKRFFFWTSGVEEMFDFKTEGSTYLQEKVIISHSLSNKIIIFTFIPKPTVTSFDSLGQ